jgi:hypothetical protein
MVSIGRFRHIQIIDDGKLVCDSCWVDRIERECAAIVGRGERFSNNYTLRRLELEKHLSFDLLVDEKKIVTWAGLFNGGRYPHGVYRIMNRLYINPEYRSKTLAYVPFARLSILPLQLERYRARIRLLFLSRDGLRAKYFLRRWVKYNAFERDWEISPRLIQVASSEKRSGYQYIAFKKFKDIAWNPKSVDEKSWMSLPE